MFADEIRRAVEAAPRDRLPQVAEALWKAFAAGGLSEAEAEELSSLIEARKALPVAPKPVKLRIGSKPRTDASMERRRRWASAGRLPPQLAARFTLAEQAVLAVVAAEVAARGTCRLAYEHLSALAGVSKSTTKSAMRRARELGLITVTERRSSAWRNLPNVVAIVAREWLAWMRLARRPTIVGGGVKTSPPTNTESLGMSRRRASGPVERVAGVGGGISRRRESPGSSPASAGASGRV